MGTRPLRRPPELRPDRRGSDMPANSFSRIRQTLTSSSVARILFMLFAALLLLSLIFRRPSSAAAPEPKYAESVSYLSTISSDSTSPGHLLFGIASSASTWPSRRDYIRAWWLPGVTRGLVFLDSPLSSPEEDEGIPPIRVSSDTSRFPYSFRGGRRSAIRVARIAKELFDAFDGNFSYGEVRWIVLGDDDTVFLLDNLVATLAKYDWEQWYYIGSMSESVEQNIYHFFGMAFGGGGFAISYPLARVLSKVMDSCLMRYGNLYGSDARVFACLAELGVGLTHEPGFHQIDLRGNILGLLSTHPLAPMVSLHHLDSIDPLFPDLNRKESLSRVLKAVANDPGRILQQSVCYDRRKLLTISVSWGFTVQVFEGNQVLTDLLASPLTFRPWKRGRNATSNMYMFNTRNLPRDQCKRPAIFFLESVSSSKSSIESNYSRNGSGNCLQGNILTKSLRKITVYSEKYHVQAGKALRRHCCDVLDSSLEQVMNVSIRKCRDIELIAPNP
ncbi:hypothetical protein AXF42_Ash016988 [Apostasia shenzhenica]|uniref:Uncharacterized protein n=1 Tax=Apostasia shenzhenica TaxID=1088818 RepID=A0A2I0B7C8_9ASPA|nr:hypothetical protein AXF42_Ash016988 [Apostasia shenzhenica]